MKIEVRTAIGQDTFVYDEDMKDISENQEMGDTEIVEQVLETPIARIDDVVAYEVLNDTLLSYEPDEKKRAELEEYISKLSEDAKLEMLDVMKTFHGGPPEIADIMQSVNALREEAAHSKMVFLRNAMFAAKAADITKLSQQISRMLNGVSKDDPFNSLLTNGLSKYTSDLHEQIATLAGAIYHMASKLGYDVPTDPYGLPIDIEKLVKLTIVIGSGVRTWAATSVTSKRAITELEGLLKSAQSRISVLEAIEEENRQERLRRIEDESKRKVRASEGFYIMNHTGWFVGCSVPPEEGNQWRLSPTNIFLTVDMDKALDLATIDDARLLLDSLKEWHSKHYQTNRLFKKKGVSLDTLFIGQFNINRVEG